MFGVSCRIALHAARSLELPPLASPGVWPATPLAATVSANSPAPWPTNPPRDAAAHREMVRSPACDWPRSPSFFGQHALSRPVRLPCDALPALWCRPVHAPHPSQAAGSKLRVVFPPAPPSASLLGLPASLKQQHPMQQHPVPTPCPVFLSFFSCFQDDESSTLKDTEHSGRDSRHDLLGTHWPHLISQSRFLPRRDPAWTKLKFGLAATIHCIIHCVIVTLTRPQEGKQHAGGQAAMRAPRLESHGQAFLSWSRLEPISRVMTSPRTQQAQKPSRVEHCFIFTAAHQCATQSRTTFSTSPASGILIPLSPSLNRFFMTTPTMHHVHEPPKTEHH